jgi:hypothetical protein
MKYRCEGIIIKFDIVEIEAATKQEAANNAYQELQMRYGGDEIDEEIDIYEIDEDGEWDDDKGELIRVEV